MTAINKASEINNNPKIYGTFAEIGAGQEVARFFFLAGRASQTIAKTMSAYDMIFSDEIYGKEKSGRYVCESRLTKMLEKEYALIDRRLAKVRGEKTQFFAFANTVATGDGVKKFSHGWMGIKFQKKVMGPTHEIIIHIRLLDKYRLQQQEVLGILGVNLVHAAFNEADIQSNLISRLTDLIRPGQIAIDFISVAGPEYAKVNHQLLALELVQKDLTEAVLFGADSKVKTISDELYQKPLLIQRGHFKPVTNTHLDILDKGKKQFKSRHKKEPLVLLELVMGPNADQLDFLDRVKGISLLGYPTLVTRFTLFYKLKRFVRTFTQEPLALIFSAWHLKNLFDETHYQDLEGGALEGLSKLLSSGAELFVYPHKDQKICLTSKSFFPHKNLINIYSHFTTQNKIIDIEGCDEALEYYHSDEVAKLIHDRNSKWKDLVPAALVGPISKENLFGFWKKQLTLKG